jgi:2,4-dienoyl-CoA reductase (NADPH2)
MMALPGVGLIITENASIDWEVGRTTGNPIRLDHDRFRTALGELTEAVHNEGAKTAVQLHHTGRQNSRANIETGEPPISASDGPASLYGDLRAACTTTRSQAWSRNTPKRRAARC